MSLITVGGLGLENLKFNQWDILPWNILWNQINWNLVFRNAIDIYYPSPINWNSCTDKDWEFDPVKFYFTCNYRRLWLDKRTEYLSWLKQIVSNFEKYSEKNILSLCSYSEAILAKILLIVDTYEVAPDSLDFVNEFRDIIHKISYVSLWDWQPISISSVLSEINICLGAFYEWDSKMWEDLPNKLYQNYAMDDWKLIKYQNQDWTLDVDWLLSDLQAHWSWNEEIMLLALYTSTCSQYDLERLQKWVIAALESKFQKLDTYKIFIILEWVIPFIYEWFKIKFDFPEIFNPKYLSKISISNLDIDKFTSKVITVWANEGWPLEIQEKLIEQFKQYWSSEPGKIWFWQWSEQLWYWTRVTWYLNEKNFQNYLKGDEYWDDKRPIPNILKQPTTKTKLIEVLS